MRPVPILGCSSMNALGKTLDDMLQHLLQGVSGIKTGSIVLGEPDCSVGEIREPLAPLPKSLSHYSTRCCQIAYNCFLQLEDSVRILKEKYPADRLGVVIGTSASGTETVENCWQDEGNFPFDYQNLHSFGMVADFLKQLAGFEGVSYAVSTACSSAANALITSTNLINSGVCDAVLTGGVEALCRTTFYGFSSLQIVDVHPCRPFDEDRAGVNLGEGATLFLLGRDCIDVLETNHPVYILGAGWSSDGYHMTAPDPTGEGAVLAMKEALSKAKLNAHQIDYINMHGTGTPLNDLAEAEAVFRLFNDDIPCSSTKGCHGHLLGAAAAVEVAICMLALKNGFYPLNANLENLDPKIRINIIREQKTDADIQIALSNSFAFGGNNTSIILGV